MTLREAAREQKSLKWHSKNAAKRRHALRWMSPNRCKWCFVLPTQTGTDL